jgi:predicted anti-sigma-YlaC factor YlaD
MTTDALTCRELVEIVTDYLEDALPPPERARFEEHLSMCSGCRAYLDQMRRTLTTLGTLPEESIPQQARDDLLNAFRTWKQQSPDPRSP